jgi:hypothetical protein
MRIETFGIWTANLSAVTLAPALLGRTGAGLADFTIYAATAASVLVTMEDGRALQGVINRPDIRNYFQVRVVLVAVLAIGPFLIGRVFAS